MNWISSNSGTEDTCDLYFGGNPVPTTPPTLRTYDPITGEQFCELDFEGQIVVTPFAYMAKFPQQIQPEGSFDLASETFQHFGVTHYCKAIITFDRNVCIPYEPNYLPYFEIAFNEYPYSMLMVEDMLINIQYEGSNELDLLGMFGNTYND